MGSGRKGSGNNHAKKKYSDSGTEKISYKHKIKKHGKIVFNYKFFEKLKRKKECDFSHGKNL